MKALSDFAGFPRQLKALVNNAIPAMGYVRRVSDGDTATIVLDRRFFDSSLKRIRLRGVNAPELSTAEGVKARDVLAELLPADTPIVVTTHKKTYDRYEGDVKFLLKGKVTDLAEHLLALGIVVPS